MSTTECVVWCVAIFCGTLPAFILLSLLLCLGALAVIYIVEAIENRWNRGRRA